VRRKKTADAFYRLPLNPLVLKLHPDDMVANCPVIRLVGELPPAPLSSGKNSVKGNKIRFSPLTPNNITTC